MKPGVTLRDATEADLDFIMTTERLPGRPETVGTFSRQAHLGQMARDGTRYVLGDVNGGPAGFAVLRRDADDMGNLQLHRFAMRQAGIGHGALILDALIRQAFATSGIERLWLDVLPGNSVARRLYGKLGFREEGVMRGALGLPDGSRRDLLLMARLRRDPPAEPAQGAPWATPDAAG